MVKCGSVEIVMKLNKYCSLLNEHHEIAWNVVGNRKLQKNFDPQFAKI
jgi:hypothetical protein